MSVRPLKSPFFFACVALVAGLWWIPIAELERLGFTGAWASAALSAGALPLLAILAFGFSQGLSRNAFLGASAIGAALALYGIAFTKTDIVRVMVLFYIAPFWTLAIEAMFQKRKIRVLDLMGLTLLLIGILAIQQFNIEITAAFSSGDLIALASGLLFAIGSALLFSEERIHVHQSTLVLVLISIMVSCLFGFGEPKAMTDLFTLKTAAYWTALVFGSLYLVPIMAGTVYAASLLSPTVLTTLLSLEIVSGFVSAALFGGEPFGMIRIIGSLLLMLAIALVSSSGTGSKGSVTE